MKVKDLTKHDEKSLKGLKLRTTNGVVGYFCSEFNAGVFFSAIPEINTQVRERLYPQIYDKREDILEWTVVGDEMRVNCDMLTSLKHIVNPLIIRK